MLAVYLNLYTYPTGAEKSLTQVHLGITALYISEVLFVLQKVVPVKIWKFMKETSLWIIQGNRTTVSREADDSWNDVQADILVIDHETCRSEGAWEEPSVVHLLSTRWREQACSSATVKHFLSNKTTLVLLRPEVVCELRNSGKHV